MKRSRTISGRIPWEGYTTFWCFSGFKYGVTLVEDRVQFVLQSKRGRKHTKSSVKTDKVPFRKPLAG